LTGAIILDRKHLRSSQCQRNFIHKSFSGCCNLPKKFLMMTIPACFPMPVTAHSSLRDVAVIPNQHNNFSLDPIVAALAGRPLQGLSPVSVSPILKWRTQCLNELIFITSSSYTLLRRLWISIELESAIRNSVSTPPTATHAHNIRNFNCSCVQCTWLTGAPMILVELDSVALWWVKQEHLLGDTFTGQMYEGWNFNSGNYLFTTDTK